MDQLQEAWWGQHFTVQYRTKRGTEFQDWFVTIAGLAYGSDFDPVRSYGKKGDFKCDGRRLSNGQLFQCYAPGEIKDVETITKINGDLAGAVEHWKDFLKIWCFVHNARDGLPPTVTQHLDLMEKKHAVIGIHRWGEPSLRELVFSLADQKLVHLFGYAPTLAMVHQLGYADLQPVIDAISQSQPDPGQVPLNPPSPEKLEKNELSPDAAQLLRVGRLKERLVEEYLAQQVWPETANRIAEAVRAHYQALKLLKLPADEIFARLRQFIGSSSEPKREAAELAVMSYFFHRCDIFEDPERVSEAA
jgi:ABC-3C protein